MSHTLLRPFQLRFIFLMSLSTGLIWLSCNTAQDNPETAKTIIVARVHTEKVNAYLLSLFDTVHKEPIIFAGDTLQNSNVYRTAYSIHQYQPFWMNENGITKNADDYIKILKEIKYDGLKSEDYFTAALETALNQYKQKDINEQSLNHFEVLMTRSFFTLSHDMLFGKDSAVFKKKDWKNKNDSIVDLASILLKTIAVNDVERAVNMMRPKHRYYAAFRNEYIRLEGIKNKGGWDVIYFPTDSISNGDTLPHISTLRKRLFTEIRIPSDTSSKVWNNDLAEAVKTFQYLNGLKSTGKMDTSTLSKLNVDLNQKLSFLSKNMERLRWMKHDFPQPYIWVDVPKMELDYVENDAVKFNMRAVVGRPSRATTMLDAKLENIVFSPPWTVPPTIMKEEVVPGIARRGGAYLSRRGLKAYDRRGRIVNASAINAKNYRSFSIGQAPGYRSSLGEVKFNLPNPWSIYLHDTPHREDFVKNYRALSSGCIRVHHPKEFAAFLLQDSSQYSYAKIDSICKKRKTVFVPFKRDVVVHIVYLTNALDSTGNVMYLKDIYKWN